MRIIQYPTIPTDQGPHLPITGLHFGPDGRTLAAVVRLDTWIVYPVLWDLDRDEPVDLRGIGAEEDAGFAPDPALSPDFRFLAHVYIERGPEYSLRVIDRSRPAKSPARERRLAVGPGFPYRDVLALQFSPDGRYLVAASVAGERDEDGGLPRREDEQGGIYRWDVDRIVGGRGRKLDGHLLPDPAVIPTPVPESGQLSELSGTGRVLAFSPDGSSLTAGVWNGRVLRWAFPSGAELPAPRLKARRDPWGWWRLAHSPDGRTLAVADQTVTLFDAATAARRAELPAGPPVRVPNSRALRPAVHDLAFDPSGRVLATANGDGLVRWWEAETGAPRRTFDWGIGEVSAVAFSPDGTLAAAAGPAGRVAVWDVDV